MKKTGGEIMMPDKFINILVDVLIVKDLKLPP